MGLESPQTYAEWYWKNGLDMSLARSVSDEETLAPVVSQILTDSGIQAIIPGTLQDYYSKLMSPPSPGWEDVQRTFLGVITRGIDLVAGEEMARPFKYETAEKFLGMRIDPEVAILLKQRQKITDELYLHRMHSGGFADDEARHIYNARFPYPSLPEIITYSRYHDVPDNPKEFAWKLYDIPPADWQMWNWLSFQKLNTEQVLSLGRRVFWTPERTELELSRLGWPSEERTALNDLSYTLPNSMLQVQGLLMQETSQDAILKDISKTDIHPAYAETYLDAILTKPSTMDVIAYELRQDPSLNQLHKELRKIGVHPEYNDVYKTLAYPIPPIQDIITMAVREAFTPAIAQRFGQYEDLPPEYLEWAGKKGLTREWAERYWAAHWSLPSPTQGFEMLHRGIISKDDLNLLLRASDVMPFWRNKLIEMAYRPLTRVDVRRMFRLGVLDEAGIDKAYRDVGYNEKNAKLMTEFTIKHTRESLSGFRASDVINAYSKRFIDGGQARSLLRDIGTKDTEIDYIIRSADHKREWFNKQERMDAIANLYKKGRYSISEARSALSQIGLQSDYIETLLEQWELKSEADKEATWTSAQTLKFLKMGLIDQARARQEFDLLGYNTERINVYMASMIEPAE